MNKHPMDMTGNEFTEFVMRGMAVRNAMVDAATAVAARAKRRTTDDFTLEWVGTELHLKSGTTKPMVQELGVGSDASAQPWVRKSIREGLK